MDFRHKLKELWNDLMPKTFDFDATHISLTFLNSVQFRFDLF